VGGREVGGAGEREFLHLSCEIGIPQVSAKASSNSIAVHSIAVFYPRAPEQRRVLSFTGYSYSPST